MQQRASLILASSSPRRAFLLKECDFEFHVRPTHAAEDFDPETPVNEVPATLATRKAETLIRSIRENELILTADTVVIFENEILNKPKEKPEAIAMLKRLSGNTHKVITAVCLTNKYGSELLEETSWVTFYELSDSAIKDYVENFKPFDKAGAYGAQECLPENYNPCSGHEREFLKRIGKPDLLNQSKPKQNKTPLIAIREIAGSYFNVMGLPIAHLYDKLKGLLG